MDRKTSFRFYGCILECQSTLSLAQAQFKEDLSYFLQLSLVTRKPVFGVCNQVRLKLVSSASEAS